MLFKYSGKYVNIYSNMKITYLPVLLCSNVINSITELFIKVTF